MTESAVAVEPSSHVNENCLNSGLNLIVAIMVEVKGDVDVRVKMNNCLTLFVII